MISAGKLFIKEMAAINNAQFFAKLPNAFLSPINSNQSHASFFYGKIVENEINLFKNVSKHLSKQRKITQTKSKITIYQLANYHVFTKYQFD